MQLKIVSWNIWIDGHFDQIKDFLHTADADIIGLQEVKNDDPSRDIIGYLGQLGYNHAFTPVKHSWGDKIYMDASAVFSKYPIVEKETYILSDINPRGAIRADIKVGERLLHVFSTHPVHTHQKFSELQEAQIDNLLKVIPEDQAIVMGDFNATPESKVIQKMKNVLVDTDPASTPTWSVYPEGCPTCNPQKIDTRLDYIFVSKDIKSHSFKVEESKGSDHLPISVIVEI